ncbi:serine protease [Patescibacteria group bacterium]|nr:serine protease [Patescibacteria group bacterium]
MKNTKKHLRKYSRKIAIGAIFLSGIFLISFGYMAYAHLQKRFEVISAANAQYQEQLQISVTEAQNHAKAAEISAAQTSASLELEQKKNAELAEDLVSTREDSEKQITELKSKITKISTSKDTSDIAKEWEQRVGVLACGDENNTWSGSGTAFKGQYGAIGILTNYHVINGATYCFAAFPGDSQYYYIGSENFVFDNSPQDWAYLFVTDPSSSLFANAAQWSFCQENQLSIGDKIMILGYPSNGSQSSITVTQGIISGYESEYFVTDGKIDHGNSGGAAIQVESNCYFGIPTAANVGEIESYGRILAANAIF